jgi:small subunit ribosomal protein S3
MLDKIIRAGALGAEIRLGGKLPSDRAKSWRFSSGLLKKTGDTAKIVNRAQAIAKTMLGVIGVKVAILPPDAKIHDQIEVNDELRKQLKMPVVEEVKPKKRTKKEKKK